ncbi:permease prefix domain 1-containing protein [Nocardioides sp. SYSU D00038]|uniref:permease prefix domain 1-containing protein n=1 Tax=Nocardioides sp. SYSU D00038 TaxID=2812554 RepID=UPI0019676B3D|nr:permease prefix domain 1-containing protein [Nocardioides sp. SYSU D00038]
MTTPVTDHVRELGAALRGPQRVRRGLVREAADHLADATDAYVAAGLDRAAAERRAVADFGTVAEVAPAFQTTLAVASSRRTAWAFLLGLLPQPFLWDKGLNLSARADDATPDSALTAVLDTGIEMVGAAIFVGTVLSLVATGIGNRWWHAGVPVARATGRFAVVAALALPATVLVSMTLTPGTDALLWLEVAVLLGGPMALSVVLGRRCLAVAG